MRLFTLFILFSTLFMTQGEVFANCAVDSGVDANLGTYIRETTEKVRTLESDLPNICGNNPPTPLVSVSQVASVIQKAKSGTPLMNGLVKDFGYRFLSVVHFEVSPKVLNHGNILSDLEKNTLIPTFDRLAAKCQLDGQAETGMVNLLSRNNDLQDFFKDVVIGNVGVAPTGDAVKAGILRTYRPENNTTCSDKDDMSSAIAKLMKKTEGFGKDITKARENWDEAIALIRGTSNGGVKKYQELQASLLRAELGRQGLSQNAIAQMMKNLACAQAESNETLNTEEQARAKEKCTRNYVIGYDKLKKSLESLKWKARTSDEYITLHYRAQDQIIPDVDILTTYSSMSTMLGGENNAEATTNKIITDLTSIHANLTSINTVLEQRIPKMQENCKKGNPSIDGGCSVK